MSSGSSSRTASSWTRNLAAPLWKRRTRSTTPPAIVAWWARRRGTRERSLSRSHDAGAHRGRDHDGLPDRVHAHGPRDDLWLHRVLGSRPALVRQPDFRPHGAAELRGDDERHPFVGPAV